MHHKQLPTGTVKGSKGATKGRVIGIYKAKGDEGKQQKIYNNPLHEAWQSIRLWLQKKKLVWVKLKVYHQLQTGQKLFKWTYSLPSTAGDPWE